MNGRYFTLLTLLFVTAFGGCAPIEYSVVIVEASQAISEAKVAGAACTQAQLDALSPVTQNTQPESGTELASTEESPAKDALAGTPMCNAPYEYYKAMEYMSKAREEVGYSDYEAAVAYARKSREAAKKAREISTKLDQERGR